MVGHCRCPFNCGAPGRNRRGCSCSGGKSHRCRGLAAPTAPPPPPGQEQEEEEGEEEEKEEEEDEGFVLVEVEEEEEEEAEEEVVFAEPNVNEEE